MPAIYAHARLNIGLTQYIGLTQSPKLRPVLVRNHALIAYESGGDEVS